MAEQLDRLLSIMAMLRDPDSGCEWDRAQDFASIAPYTIEEAYEVADAIEREAWQDLREELGDLLLQVVFHSRMAQEAGLFDFAAVAGTIADKMEARHPHIFGSADGTMDSARWEDLKAAERADKGAQSALDGVARALPALMRAEKLQKRAAREGFDWPSAAGPVAKLSEELTELESATTDAERLDEAGDVLFTAVNIVRAYGIDPEAALRSTNAKFERRYRAMERTAGARLKDMELEELELHWQQAKRSEG